MTRLPRPGLSEGGERGAEIAAGDVAAPVAGRQGALQRRESRAGQGPAEADPRDGEACRVSPSALDFVLLRRAGPQPGAGADHLDTPPQSALVIASYVVGRTFHIRGESDWGGLSWREFRARATTEEHVV